MFLDMANSGLVILGASKYENDPTLDRNVFLEGSERIESYFKSIKDGLGIEPKNILNLFDSENSPEHQQTEIQSFISSRRIDDLFVYIIGHGFTRRSDFYLFLKTSQKGNINSSMNISILLQFVNDFGDFRTFVFIDACESGSIHVFDPVTQVMPVLAGYISSADATRMPRSGMSILTSNNKSDLGLVLADDSQEDVKTPLFTHELLNLLKTGTRRGQKFGFSINYLREILEKRIEVTLKAIDRSDLILSSRPEVTDLTNFDKNSIAILSDIGLFPNNDPSNSLIIKASKKVRLNYSYIKDLQEQNFQLVNKNDVLKSDNCDKHSLIISLREECENLSQELQAQKAAKTKAIAQKTGFMYACAVLVLTMTVSLAVSIAFIRPVTIDQIMQLIKK